MPWMVWNLGLLIDTLEIFTGTMYIQMNLYVPYWRRVTYINPMRDDPSVQVTIPWSGIGRGSGMQQGLPVGEMYSFRAREWLLDHRKQHKTGTTHINHPRWHRSTCRLPGAVVSRERVKRTNGPVSGEPTSSTHQAIQRTSGRMSHRPAFQSTTETERVRLTRCVDRCERMAKG